MATLEPFRALRPLPDRARAVCELPYDVMSSEEARELARSNPTSFLRISKPEINFPPGKDPTGPDVYRRARQEFDQLRQQGLLQQDPVAGFYLYRLTMGAHRQTGLVAVASCAEYRAGIVRRHELTRPDKEDDRVRHIEVLDAQTGPAFLTYRASAEVDQVVTTLTQLPAETDYVAMDGVRHEGWTVFGAENIAALRSAFARMERLYVADGHHRTAAASRVDESRDGAGHSSRFLAVVFPHDQMQVLPYHRVVHDLNGLSPQAFLERLRAVGEVGPAKHAAPVKRHELGLFLGEHWYTLRLKPAMWDGHSAEDALDVALLQRHILGPVLGIDDPRTSERIHFVGGIRGTGELEKAVVKSGSGCAFALFPTSVEELMAVADRGGMMPPKSTWFEPKLRDGLFIHTLGD